MKIVSVDSSEIARIGEIDRTEIIRAKYRCVLATDSNAIVLLKEEIDPPETFPHWDDEGVRQRAKWWKREIDAGGLLLLAEDNGQVVGFAVLGAEKADQCAEMVALFVDKAYRGQGLGRQLVRRLETEPRERGIKNIYVHSNETVASVEFYRSVGYRIVCLMDASIMWLPGMGTIKEARYPQNVQSLEAAATLREQRELGSNRPTGLILLVLQPPMLPLMRDTTTPLLID